jgi:argininosuccinate lyase
VFGARRDVRGALGALTVLVAGLELDHERLAEAVSDPALLATDEAERLVAEGVPFRDAYGEVAASIRDGSFEPAADAAASIAARAPGPGGVREAVAEARKRFSG